MQTNTFNVALRKFARPTLRKLPTLGTEAIIGVIPYRSHKISSNEKGVAIYRLSIKITFHLFEFINILPLKVYEKGILPNSASFRFSSWAFQLQ